ncbi:hypothetical protein NZD89_02430 [Alicyclobacillus fastidiosus]|uniref:Uncharacterized protein n=1 Tax=Alicyclobacillus fastidiosus TaxID=392011 RepID=A0ABY6ZJN8_9BACL|nr:hypothetical protein [Alicyclobacillus fastidiosus]WAH42381.1 hypothetical protein NZD89_02430 [Alicyclobacillus fastidiosus]GMA64197.1 hypothetical protein GCM10025859_46370 [Alicyclobacillus fastidiosus]
MSKRKISISFRDPAVYEFVMEKANTGISAYVCDLIRRDMNRPKEEDLDKKVEEIVRRLLQNADGITLSPNNQPKKNSLSDEDRELLKSLF